MFILEERVQNCCLHRYKGLSCRTEVRFILHGSGGQNKGQWGRFWLSLGIAFCWLHISLKGVNCLEKVVILDLEDSHA